MNHLEVIAAAPEIISSALGDSPRDPHPLAERLRHESLTAVAHAYGAKARPPQPGELPRAVQARGLITQDFQTALAEGARPLLRRRFDAAARHLAFATEIPVRDFREQSVGAIDNSFELVETAELRELEVRPVALAAGVKSHALRTFGRVLKISRGLLENDHIGLLSGILAAVGDAAGRLEASLVYAAIETNPNLDDDGPAFHLDNGNVLAQVLDETQLGAAINLLARQTDMAGTLGDLQPKTLVVASDLTVKASKLITECGLALALVASAHLPAGRWYLMAGKEAQPVVGVLRLDGRNTIQLVPAKSAFHGIAFRVLFDTNAVLLGRTGIVRGGA